MNAINCVFSIQSCSIPTSSSSTLAIPSTPFLKGIQIMKRTSPRTKFKAKITRRTGARTRGLILRAFLTVDPWAPNIDSQSIATQFFALSLFPYLGFLYFITKSKSTPKLTLFGFYFLLAFVGATIPAGIYAKVHYGTSLSNVDWLHGGAESLLTLSNLCVVLGLRKAVKESRDFEEKQSDGVSQFNEEKSL